MAVARRAHAWPLAPRVGRWMALPELHSQQHCRQQQPKMRLVLLAAQRQRVATRKFWLTMAVARLAHAWQKAPRVGRLMALPELHSRQHCSQPTMTRLMQLALAASHPLLTKFYDASGPDIEIPHHRTRSFRHQAPLWCRDDDRADAGAVLSDEVGTESSRGGRRLRCTM